MSINDLACMAPVLLVSGLLWLETSLIYYKVEDTWSRGFFGNDLLQVHFSDADRLQIT